MTWKVKSGDTTEHVKKEINGARVALRSFVNVERYFEEGAKLLCPRTRHTAMDRTLGIQKKSGAHHVPDQTEASGV